MPRPTYIAQSIFPYHVRCRARNREWYDLPMDEMWTIMTEHLYFAQKAFGLRLHQFVLMENHYHLTVTTPNSNLCEAMAYFNRETTRSIHRQSGRINQIYGGRYKWSLINTYHYFMNVYKYVYRNPVEPGLASRCEEYKYSSLHGLLGQSRLFLPLANDTLLFEDISGVLNWLNTKPEQNDREAMKLALRHQVFKLPRTPETGLTHPLVHKLY